MSSCFESQVFSSNNSFLSESGFRVVSQEYLWSNKHLRHCALWDLLWVCWGHYFLAYILKNYFKIEAFKTQMQGQFFEWVGFPCCFSRIPMIEQASSPSCSVGSSLGLLRTLFSCLNTLILKNYLYRQLLKHKCRDSFLSELGSFVVSQEYPWSNMHLCCFSLWNPCKVYREHCFLD